MIEATTFSVQIFVWTHFVPLRRTVGVYGRCAAYACAPAVTCGRPVPAWPPPPGPQGCLLEPHFVMVSTCMSLMAKGGAAFVCLFACLVSSLVRRLFAVCLFISRGVRFLAVEFWKVFVGSDTRPLSGR